MPGMETIYTELHLLLLGQFSIQVAQKSLTNLYTREDSMCFFIHSTLFMNDGLGMETIYCSYIF